MLCLSEMSVKKIILLYLMNFSISGLLIAQEGKQINGTIVNANTETFLGNVSISIITAKDSILVRSTRTKADGGFELKVPTSGMYILSASHVQFVEYNQVIEIKDNESLLDLGVMKLEKKSIVLEEVTVKSKKLYAITVKGDTLEFQADSFKVRENARVGELLRQLPNFEVDKKGNITALGERVKRVLLDGEEFFGDDPTLITNNIRSDIVDKIQLYDGDSKQAELAGNNFGKKEKTINVILKDDKKKGVFGKAHLAGGTPEIFDVQAMLNSFSPRRKAATYGILSNNGVTGLGWEDKSDFSNNEFGMDDLDGRGGRFDGKGIPTIKTTGAHYDESYFNKNIYINANYKLADLLTSGLDNNLSENIQPNNSFTRYSNENFNTNNLRQKFDIRVRLTPDTANTFNIYLEANKNNKAIKSTFFDRTVRQDGTKLYDNQRDLDIAGSGSDLSGFLVWSKKLNSKSSISARFNASTSGSNFEHILGASSNFYNTHNSIDSVTQLSEKKLNDNRTGQYGIKFAYSTHFGENFNFKTEYDFGSKESNSEMNVKQLDPDYGTNNFIRYSLKQITHKTRASLGFSKAKFFMDLGPGIELSDQNQNNYISNNIYRRQFINWQPSLESRYSFTKQARTIFRYSGETTQPVISQIQPIQINDDPLNIFIGNPGLKPSFKHNFNLNFRDYAMIEDRTILFNARYSLENNSIAPKVTTDLAGKSTYEYTNHDNFRPASFDFYLIYSFKFLPADIRINSDIGYSHSKTANYVNGILNENNVQRANASVRLTKRKVEKFDLTVLFNAKSNIIKTSLDNNLDATYWSYMIVPDFIFYPNDEYEICLDASYDYQQPISFLSDELQRFIINLKIGKNFLKDRSLVLQASANDLLNQSKGFTRFVNNNMIVENTYTTIGRNVTLALIWDLNRMGK